MLPPLDGVAMHAGAECGADTSGRAAELDEGMGSVDLNAGEVVACKPGRNGGEVAIGWAEGRAEVFRLEPLVIRGGGLVLLLVDKLLQSRFLLGAALEDQHDSAERRGIGQGALVELGAGQRVSIPGKCRDPR